MEWLSLAIKVARVVETSKTEEQRKAAARYVELAETVLRNQLDPNPKKTGPISRFFSKLGL